MNSQHRDAATRQGIAVDRVDAWLGGLLPHARAPFDYVRIGDGRSNLTFEVRDAADSTWVLRRPPLGPRLPGAHDMAREHRLQAALHPAGVRVPQPMGLCEDEHVTGAPFYVMERVDGRVIGGADDLDGVTADGAAAATRSLVEALAELHAVDIDEAGLGDLARRQDYGLRQLKGWWRQWEASRTRDIPLVETVRDALTTAVPEQRRDAVVHGDFKLENVMLGEDQEVRAILDWELCTLGDPLADLGTLLTYWIEPGDPDPWALAGADAPTRRPGFLTRAEVKEEYARRTGDSLEGLDFFEAQGCWKLAIILQGVIRRFRDTPGNANTDPDAFEPIIDALLGRAMSILRRSDT